MKGKLIGWTAAGLAGVGVFAGVANAASDAPTPTPTTQTASKPAVSQKTVARIEHRLLHGAARGEIVLDNKKGLQTVDFQRGATSGSSASAVTVTDETGTPQTWAVSTSTKVRERGVSSPTLSDGEKVVVVGVKSDGTLTARLIVIVPAKPTTTSPAQPTT